ncbi:RdgB/HAM1 family non-canonical purine NTP pyrophosphatase [Myxococcota bacterium]|nr:RdgB/HAM1 family non-canonical purine NTP pyrophosphatase [Myxococcota bacterium]
MRNANGQVVLATSNAGKVKEFQAILSGRGFDLRGLGEFPELSFPEEGDDYEANAIGKARAAALHVGMPALADDSGLEVDALDGIPGVYSARFGGEGLDDRGRTELLLERMSHLEGEDRRARFVCWVAYVVPGGGVLVSRGECPGRILTEPRGARGFGYDPIFGVEGTDLAMAELSAQEKNRISHRARALDALCERIAASQ